MAGTRIVGSGTGIFILAFGAAALGQPLPNCNIEFDDSCPDASPECGATFSGGESCVVEGLGDCYSSGNFGFKVTPAAPLTITLAGDLVGLRVFFAHQGAASGTMRVFDAQVGGNEVGSPLHTNGDCLLFMPSLQSLPFCSAVRRIEVTAVGGTVWIDDFHVNPVLSYPDCNINGVPDECDIAGGASLDCNGNNIPDDCEYPGCAGILPGDMNCDGQRDGRDIRRFVGTLVSGGYTCQADINQDGAVDSADLPGLVSVLLGL